MRTRALFLTKETNLNSKGIRHSFCVSLYARFRKHTTNFAVIMACSSYQKEHFNPELTEFDMDVIRLNIYDKQKRIVANINHVSCKKEEFFFVCLEISPLYSVDTVEGKIVKKRTHCRSSLFILIPGQAAKRLEEKWTSSSRRDCFVITFNKKQMYKFTSKSGSFDVPCVVIITGDTLGISDCFPEYRQTNPCNLLLNDLTFPEVLMKIIKPMEAIKIFEIQKIKLVCRSQEENETMKESPSLKKSSIPKRLRLDAEYRINPFCKKIQKIKKIGFTLPPVMIETNIPVKQIDSRGSFDKEFECKWSAGNS